MRKNNDCKKLVSLPFRVKEFMKNMVRRNYVVDCRPYLNAQAGTTGLYRLP